MAPPSSGGAGPGAGESDRGAARASVGAASERAQSSSSECAAMPGIAAAGGRPLEWRREGDARWRHSLDATRPAAMTGGGAAEGDVCAK